jgi:ribosomal protein L37AE/L43A
VAILRKVTCPCAQCGATIIAPEWSEHLSERRVRHTWSCETCGYQFESTVYFPASGPAPTLEAA